MGLVTRIDQRQPINRCRQRLASLLGRPVQIMVVVPGHVLRQIDTGTDHVLEAFGQCLTRRCRDWLDAYRRSFRERDRFIKHDNAVFDMTSEVGNFRQRKSVRNLHTRRDRYPQDFTITGI